ncbi:flightin [Dendroctonus ponderosae]|uniref:Flightin n=1 Tax=Dendroctonus ponderosae TaxID=77166 RepID=J3JU98_DENPD|nr:flightin [Dendroctonus ponderosae]AEE61773.1 unknown [Dendroctonus ponderosae]
MDDDNSDWFSAADDAAPEPAAAAAAAPAAGAAAAPEATAEGEAAAAQDEAAAPAAEAAGEDEYLDPDKLLLFKHWIRPRFLPYKYLTDYRRNYYDDVIDYLDKRCRGIFRDIPVAQTWGERVLRTYTKNSNQAEIFRQKLQDRKLIEETRFSGKFQLHHSKSYINTRYSSILY